MSKLFELHHGDCLEVLKTFPAECVDMIFADPPYNLSNDGFTCQGGRVASVNKGDWDKSNGAEEDYLFHLKWIGECRRVLKPSGTLFVTGTYHSIYACGHAIKSVNFHILNDICWLKPNASPNLSCRFFTASHETLIWARKNKNSSHTFNYSAMKNGNFPEDKLKAPGKQMRSVWSIPVAPQSEKIFGKHPTQKPLALMDRVILSSTYEDDIVLDPFCGSGSTGVSAIKHGRQFLGIEKRADFINIAQNRLEAISHQVKPEKNLKRVSK